MIRSGQKYRWVGLPGQYENTALIQVDSLMASCKINARIVEEGIEEAVSLISIHAADLVTAVEQGWLVEVEE